MYLDYEAYKSMGGKCAESQFPYLCYQAETKINYYTFNRLKSMNEIPEEVQYLETRLINILDNTDTDRDTTLSSYSNGIESFGYNTSEDNDIEKANNIRIYQIIKEYLSDYPELLQRGR